MKPSQLPSKWSVLMLCTLVSCVYLLRNSAPGFTNRSLQATPAQSTMCVGVDTSESFSQSQIDRFNNIDKYLSNVRGGNQLLDDLNSDSINSWTDFLHAYLKSLLPFIVIGLVLAFLSCVCLFCHCCNYACFRACSTPTKINKILCMGLAVLFSLAMVALAATGLYFSGGMNTGYQKGTCSVSNFMVEFSAGNTTAKWIGLAPAVESIQNVSNSISSTINGLPYPDEIHTNLTNNYTSLVGAITTYYNQSEGKNVSNPLDPNNTAVAIVPDFIANLGPATDTNTLSGAIYNEATTKYTTIDTVLNTLGSVITMLKQNSASISSLLQEGVSMADSLNSKLNTVLSDYENYAGTGKTINNIVSISLMVFFIVAIGLSVIIMLGVLNTFTKKFRWVCKLMVITRYILNIILFLSSLVLAIAWPASVMAMETCNGMKQLITNETVFNEFFPTDSIIGLVNTCFYGDGDVLGALGIEEILGNLSSVFESNQTLAQYLNIPDSEYIPSQQLYISLYENGQLPATPAITTDLNTLNGYTTAPLSCSQDTWVVNSINCTSSMGTVFNASVDGPLNNYGNPTCIGINQFVAAGYNGSQRYTSSSCSNFDAIPLVTGFQDHYKNLTTVFGTLATDLANVTTLNSVFMADVNYVISPFATVGDTINDILQTVGNSQTGLASNMNCEFIGTNTQTVVDDICIGYLPIIFETCVFLLAFVVITILGLTPIFFAGKIQMHTLESADGSLDDSFNKKYLMDSSGEEKTEMELATLRL